MDGKAPTIRIQIFEGDSVVREEVFTQTPIRIGKAGQAHLRLTDPAVSRQHAVIDYLESGEVRITDSQSTGGTFVQGRKVTQASLQPGNEIVVGSTKLVIDYVAEASAIMAGDSFQSSVSQSDLKSGKFGVDVSLLWGEYPLQQGFFPVGKTVTVGEIGKEDFFVPEQKTGQQSFEFIKPDDKFFLMNVGGDKIDADFLVEDKIIRLPEMKRRGLVIGDEWVRIDHRTAARVRYDDFTFVVGLASQPRVIKGSFWKRFSMREHMYLLLSLLIHLALLLLVALVPEEQLVATRDPYDRDTRALRKVQVAMLEKKVEEEKKEQEETKRKFEEAKESDGMVDRLSKQDPTDRETSKIVVADTENDRNVANSALTQVMGQQEAMIGRLLDSAGSGLGGGTMGIRVIGDNGIDADLASSLGAFGGTMGGGAGGFQGTGAWGGGGEYAPADIRGIAGLSKKDAEGASAKIKFKKGGPQLQVFAGNINIKGALDREMVRRYVLGKMNQIKWCYQQELQKNPELAGVVNMAWVILPTGFTAGVKIADTSLRNAAVESCIRDRISTWRFPEPKGGAAVQITSYPFVLRSVQ